MCYRTLVTDLGAQVREALATLLAKNSCAEKYKDTHLNVRKDLLPKVDQFSQRDSAVNPLLGDAFLSSEIKKYRKKYSKHLMLGHAKRAV